MSLKLHYPLRGNIAQQGIVSQTVTLMNGGPAAAADGPFGSCMAFTSTQGIRGDGNCDLNGKSGATICCWVNLTDAGKYVFSLEIGTYWQLTWCGTTFIVRDNASGNTGARKDLSMTAPLCQPGRIVHLCMMLGL